MLEHIVNYEDTIGEMSRVLKMNGIASIFTDASRNPFCLNWFILNVFGRNPLEEKYGHVNFFSTTELIKTVKNNGFEVKDVRYMFHWFMTGVNFFQFLVFWFLKLFRANQPKLSKNKPESQYLLGKIIMAIERIERFELTLFKRIPIGNNGIFLKLEKTTHLNEL